MLHFIPAESESCMHLKKKQEVVAIVEAFLFSWMHTDIVWPFKSSVVLKEFGKVVQLGKKNELWKHV